MPSRLFVFHRRKGDAEADVADGVNGERVGDGPHASGEHGPDDQVRSLADVVANVRRAADEGRDAPSREEDSEHHDEGDRDRRDVGINKLDRSFGAAQPGSSGESAEDAKGLQAAQAGGVHGALRWGRRCTVPEGEFNGAYPGG